jgi:predicted negative regulator of RcsB-dependent stress response
MPTVPPPSRDATVDPVLFWFRYRMELLAALAVLVIGAAGFIGYRVYADHRESAAAEFLAKAKSNEEYRQVIDRYPGTAAGQAAYLFLAESYRAKKDFQQANATLQTFLDKFPEHELAGAARLGMAANSESMGKPDEALSTLQKLVASNPKSFVAPVALLGQVHLLKAKGKTDEARRICENFLTQYRESYLAGEVSRELRLLKPASPTPAAATPVPPVGAMATPKESPLTPASPAGSTPIPKASSTAPAPPAGSTAIPKLSPVPTGTLPPNPAPKKP